MLWVFILILKQFPHDRKLLKIFYGCLSIYLIVLFFFFIKFKFIWAQTFFGRRYLWFLKFDIFNINSIKKLFFSIKLPIARLKFFNLNFRKTIKYKSKLVSIIFFYSLTTLTTNCNRINPQTATSTRENSTPNTHPLQNFQPTCTLSQFPKSKTHLKSKLPPNRSGRRIRTFLVVASKLRTRHACEHIDHTSGMLERCYCRRAVGGLSAYRPQAGLVMSG